MRPKRARAARAPLRQSSRKAADPAPIVVDLASGVEDASAPPPKDRGGHNFHIDLFPSGGMATRSGDTACPPFKDGRKRKRADSDGDTTGEMKKVRAPSKDCTLSPTTNLAARRLQPERKAAQGVQRRITEAAAAQDAAVEDACRQGKMPNPAPGMDGGESMAAAAASSEKSVQKGAGEALVTQAPPPLTYAEKLAAYRSLADAWPADAFKPALCALVAAQDAAVNEVSDMLMGFPEHAVLRGPMVIALAGTSGTGKSTVMGGVLDCLNLRNTPRHVHIAGDVMQGREAMGRISGADPGYLGYRDGKSVMEQMVGADAASREGGHVVVVTFEEADKASASVITSLMELLGSGAYLDSSGRSGKVSFLLVLMTMNFGAPDIERVVETEGAAALTTERMRDLIESHAYESDKWEASNYGRLSRVVPFLPPTGEACADLVRLHIKRTLDLLGAATQVTVRLSLYDRHDLVSRLAALARTETGFRPVVDAVAAVACALMRVVRINGWMLGGGGDRARNEEPKPGAEGHAPLPLRLSVHFGLDDEDAEGAEEPPPAPPPANFAGVMHKPREKCVLRLRAWREDPTVATPFVVTL